MSFIERLIRWIADICAGVAMLLLLAATVIVGYGVVMRYIVERPQPWTDELVSYMLVYIIMLAAAETIRRGDAITVDLLTARLPERWRRWVDVWGMVPVIVVALVWVFGGWDMVSFSARIHRMSDGYLAVPLTWTQFAIPMGGVLIAMAALHRLVRALGYALRADDPVTKP